MSDHHGRLDGWKAIADHLARDERTVQRWAKNRALPVHHFPGGKRASVFAFRSELDEWVAGPPPSAPSSTTVSDEVQGDSARQDPLPEIRAVGRTVGIPTIVLCIGAVIVWIATNSSEATVPDTVEVVGSTVIAQADGTTVWRYPLKRPADTPPEAIWRAASTVRPVDLNADGDSEIPVLLTLHRGDEKFVRNDLFCFSAEGQLLWRYTPQASLRFEDETFDGPWRIEKWITTGGSSRPLVWLSVIHHIWWPSFVVAIDGGGQAITRFVHPGHIYSLTEFTNETGSYVVAAGVNNEYASAMVAALDDQGPGATPPSLNPKYMCQGCPHGSPAHYLLFPRSELNSFFGQPYNRIFDATVTAGGLDVSVQEVSQPHLRAVYRLSRTFVPEGVGLSDAYWEAHRGLERDGRLDHAAKDCPDRNGMKVRLWEPEGGWREQMVPLSGGF